MVTPSVNQSNIFQALRSFLISFLPANVSVFQGQQNRVSEPSNTDFVVMTEIFKNRLSTNVDQYIDAQFTGSISGTTLTVSAIQFGALAVGNTVFGPGIAPNTTIVAFGSGTGGVGTYTLSQSKTVASETMAAGTAQILQATQIVVQLDVHGPNSADNAQLISTLFRDEYAVEQFASSGFDIAPLYASDPRQMPFLNAEQQFETRYIIEINMQANPVVIVPQQFASALNITENNIPANYPA
jgi:hypothetical protein